MAIKKAPVLGHGAVKFIEHAVDKVFDNAKASVLGPQSIGKRLYIGYTREFSLPGIFDSASRAEGAAPNLESLHQILKIAGGYIDSTRERTKAEVVREVQGFISEAARKGAAVDAETVLGGKLSEVFTRASYSMRRIVDTELQHAKHVGSFDGIVRINAAAGIEDPVLYFVIVRDRDVCSECVRLHMMPDRVTPRVWKLSEIGEGYHKRGESNPKKGGLHPHCRCTMATLMPGYGFKDGFVSYISPKHDEYEKQHGMEKSERLGKSEAGKKPAAGEWYVGHNGDPTARPTYLTSSHALASMHGNVHAYRIKPEAKWHSITDQGHLPSMDSFGYVQDAVEKMRSQGADVVWDHHDYHRGHPQIYVTNPDVLEYVGVKKSEPLGKSTPEGKLLYDSRSDLWFANGLKWKDDRESWMKELADNAGVPVEQLPWSRRHSAHPDFIEAVKNAPISINMPPLRIVDAVKQGRLVNLFETGTEVTGVGMGTTNKATRRDREAMNLRIPKDAPHHHRPVYGSLHVLHNHPAGHEGGAYQYGEAYLILHPHVKERSTFTPKDSFNVGHDEVFTHHHHESLAHKGRFTDIHDILTGEDDAANPCDYLEAQVYGGVDFSKDVAEIHVPHQWMRYNPEVHDALREVSEKHGVKVFARGKHIGSASHHPSSQPCSSACMGKMRMFHEDHTPEAKLPSAEAHGDALAKSDWPTSKYLKELERFGWTAERSSKHVILTNKWFTPARPMTISHSEMRRIGIENMENNAKDMGLIWDHDGLSINDKHQYAEHYRKAGLLPPDPNAQRTWKPTGHAGTHMEIGKVVSTKPDVDVEADHRTHQYVAQFGKGDHTSIPPVKVMDGGDGNHYVVEGDEQLHAAKKHGMTHVPTVLVS